MPAATVEGGPARLGGIADHRAQRLRAGVSQATPRRAARRDRPPTREPRRHRRRRRACRADKDCRGRRRAARWRWAPCAGVRLSIDETGTRSDHHAAGLRRCGVDRHNVVLAAGLDAVAGVVDERDIGIGRILDETRESASRRRRSPSGTASTSKPRSESSRSMARASLAAFGSAGSDS